MIPILNSQIKYKVRSEVQGYCKKKKEKKKENKEHSTRKEDRI